MHSSRSRVSGLVRDFRDLLRAAALRRKRAFRPGTTANHRSQIKTFIYFCCLHNVDFISPSVATLTAYIEHLAQRMRSYRSVLNYISAIRHLHKLSGIQVDNLNDHSVQLLLRALPFTMFAQPTRHLPITLDILTRVCDVCDNMSTLGAVLKVAFLLGFFGFLRQSNLAPPTAASFDEERHTRRRDVMFQPPGLVITLRWSKTMQDGTSTSLVPIPRLPGHPLDPVAAMQTMLKLTPTHSPRDPLLLLPGKKVVTITTLATALRAILSELGLPADQYSLHSLRRGGATESFKAGVDITHIKRHGTWRSDAVYDYITTCAVSDSAIPARLGAAAMALARPQSSE